MALDFTVVIPTFNGANRLPQILERLKSQVQTEQIQWEVVVVDNNSQDSTAAVVKAYQENWEKHYPLRYCFEDEQGLAYARQRGVEEAKGSLIGFLDDDVLPATDWVATANEFAQEHPQAGAYGGQIHGEFEIQPPENFKRIQSFLAIRERGSQASLYNPEYLVLPPGAAMVVRQQAWEESVPRRPVLKGRINGKMLAGEDYEVLLHMHRLKWEIWYNPAMHVHHQIPRQRLEKDYLLALIRGSGLCVCQLRLINAKTWQKPLIISKILLGNSRRTLLHFVKYRNQVKTDLIAACELEFFLSCLVSPFFLLQQTLQSKLKNQ